MSGVYFKEIFEYPINEFKKHLENDSNEKIIFSGKYGIGKTRFLQEYFEQETNQQKYDVYRLFPVNYSISQNEDILQYIKYDILIELLQKKASIEDFELDFIQTLPVYIQENLFKVISGAMFMIPKIGKDLADFYEKFEKLKAKFIEFHNKVNTSDGDIIIDYLEKLEAQEGSIYENNVVTKIISKTIVKGKPKESVLIVDDIDRLDPEHVFRILNVFAAHFDSPTYAIQKNKFSFDKIIIVCDFHNIRNLFHHRYGDQVDFLGYIDKFYSCDIFHFDNKNAVTNILDNIFSSIDYQTRNNEPTTFIKSVYLNNDFIRKMTILLLNRNIISLRSVLKLYKKNIDYHHEVMIFAQQKEVYSYLLPIAIQLKLLRDLLGDYVNMNRAFSLFLKNNELLEGFANYFGLLSYILSSEKHDFNRRSNSPDVNFSYLGIRMLIAPTLDTMSTRLRHVDIYEYKENQNKSPERGMLLDIPINMFWQGLLDTIQKLNQVGFLN